MAPSPHRRYRWIALADPGAVWSVFGLFLITSLLICHPWPASAGDGFNSLSIADPAYAASDSRGHATGRRVALVIGNGAYRQGALKNPTHDALDIGATLKRLGFEVILRQDASKRELLNVINEFGVKLRSAEIGLFYFAGHGVQLQGRNYLIPIGVQIETESDVEFEGVDAGRILGKMEESGCQCNIVILDACRDNPFARSYRSAARGLARMDAPLGSFVAYATAPGSVAADGTGRNGLYTSYLLKYMTTPGITLEQVFKRVRDSVVDVTGGKQVPWESTSLRGDFYFVGEGDVADSDGYKTKPSPSRDDTGPAGVRQSLEQERLELERLKIEMEKERLKAARQPSDYGSTATDPCKKIVGTWTWFSGYTVYFRENGTIDAMKTSFSFPGGRLEEKSGTWTCVEPARFKYVITWGNGVWVDTMELSADGQTLKGHNQFGFPVSGKRQ
ncbi:MAG TPA: hypothetical protein DEO88_13990 [Syntrophobacteraceae bacterium]|nr:hypothetical protein [Syntrophobacteraceae bacterium]